MIFRAGQTFLYPLNDESPCAHLWVIATEPDSDGQFAIVSLSTLRGAKDQTVILRKDEHPFLKWDTCALYALAEIATTDKITTYLDCGWAKMHQDVPAKMLREILAGFTASDHTKNRVRSFIQDYNRRAKLSSAGQL